MRRTVRWVAVLSLIAAAGSLSAADDAASVTLDNLKAPVPRDWKSVKPAGMGRIAQFVLPKGDDDKEDTDLIVFKGFGGGAKPNIARWKGQFTPPEGKVSEITIGGKPATQLDIEGAYQTAPFDPKYKGRRLPGTRMIAVYFDGPDDVYQIKLSGPAKTVAGHKKAFEDWLKSFK
jgi:hypothetical protein